MKDQVASSDRGLLNPTRAGHVLALSRDVLPYKGIIRLHACRRTSPMASDGLQHSGHGSMRPCSVVMVMVWKEEERYARMPDPTTSASHSASCSDQSPYSNHHRQYHYSFTVNLYLPRTQVPTDDHGHAKRQLRGPAKVRRLILTASGDRGCELERPFRAGTSTSSARRSRARSGSCCRRSESCETSEGSCNSAYATPAPPDQCSSASVVRYPSSWP